MKPNPKSRVHRAKIIRSVTVADGATPPNVRTVFYAKKQHVFDKRGRSCHSPAENAVILAKALWARSQDADQVLWDVLNFVFNGAVPADWIEKNWNATIGTIWCPAAKAIELIDAMSARDQKKVCAHAIDILNYLYPEKFPRNWNKERGEPIPILI